MTPEEKRRIREQSVEVTADLFIIFVMMIAAVFAMLAADWFGWWGA